MSCSTRAEQDPLSESAQMYLVAIARLREGDDPVPLSQVARELSISPVSVNEMCRKLQDQDLLVYQPYKGVSLTEHGERLAYYVLRRHRLWEVLLVDHLGLNYEQAHELACQLEHATPDLLADRLDAYLGHPIVNPVGQTIPRPDGALPPPPSTPLPAAPVGATVQVRLVSGDGTTRAYLATKGVRPGAMLTLSALTDDAVLIEISGRRAALSLAVAEKVLVDVSAGGD